MLERTLVFVDTSYLLASFYNSWETGARAQLEIDLREVVRVLDGMISKQLGQAIQRQLWYDGIPESGPHRYQRSLRSIDGVQLRAGQLIEWGNRRIQKAVDTRLVTDMVIAGLRRQASDIVLVSGDADMLPGVSEASNAGVRVHLYGFGWDSMSSALRHACDSTTILDPREDFADAMQLNVLEGPLPPIVRGKPIGDTESPDDEGATAVPDTRVSAPGSEEKTGCIDDGAEAPKPAEDAGKKRDDVPADPIARTGDAEPATPTAAAGDPQDKEIQGAAKAGRHEVPAEAQTAAAQQTTEAGSMSQPGTAAEATPQQEPAAETPEELAETAAGAAESAPGTGEAADAAVEPAEAPASAPTPKPGPKPRPNPSMMAPRRKLRSRYVPLPNEVWATAGFQTPFDVGQQYATWWYKEAATEQERDEAHLLSGGGLPMHIDRPLLQFACETLHEFTLTENQRVNLRDGFHAGIRSLLLGQRHGEGNGF